MVATLARCRVAGGDGASADSGLRSLAMVFSRLVEVTKNMINHCVTSWFC
jgi:hypothetical protein